MGKWKGLETWRELMGGVESKTWIFGGFLYNYLKIRLILNWCEAMILTRGRAQVKLQPYDEHSHQPFRSFTLTSDIAAR
jgi:hypothetical protein